MKRLGKRRGEGRPVKESSAADDWSPLYGAFGMVFDPPEIMPTSDRLPRNIARPVALGHPPENAPAAVPAAGDISATQAPEPKPDVIDELAQSSQSGRGSPDGREAKTMYVAKSGLAAMPRKAAIPTQTATKADSAKRQRAPQPQFAYGPGDEVIETGADASTEGTELLAPTVEAASELEPDKRAAQKSALKLTLANQGTLTPLAFWLAALLALATATITIFSFKGDLPKSPVLHEPHWVVAITPTGEALIGRARSTGFGTVSVRIDIVSHGPAIVQWNFLVACPSGNIEYRSGDRWTDKLRDHSLGLVSNSANWEARAARFACKGRALDGPFAGYEAAAKRGLEYLHGRTTATDLNKSAQPKPAAAGA